MTDLPVVGEEALPAIVAFCARAVSQPFSSEELAKALFLPEQPATVRFAPAVGIVATVAAGDDGWIRLLAVDPAARRRGNGRQLVAAAEDDLAAVRVITVGADAPYFLYPGVPTIETGLCALLEERKYVREETNYNVTVDLRRLPPERPGAVDARACDEREAAEWLERHWSNWRPEGLRALAQGSLLLTRDGAGIAGFCAFDVNRACTLGPIASRPDLIGTGASRDLLVSGLHRLRARGYETIEVLWVGPLTPYARVGGEIGATFFVYRKRRRT